MRRLLVLSLLLPWSANLSRADGPVQVMTTSHGLCLTLTIPRSAYPGDALVRIWARLQNVSRKTIWIWDGGPPAPGKYLPQPFVYDATGATSLPISLTDYFPYPGPGPSVLPLRPGFDRTVSELVVLRGPRIRLVLTLAARHQANRGPGPDIVTPMARISLLAPDRPRIVAAPTPNEPLRMHIEPPSGVSGPPLGVYYADCGGTNFDQSIWWTRLARYIAPGCTPVLAWHVLVGWLDHSVVTIDYPVRSAPSRYFEPELPGPLG